MNGFFKVALIEKIPQTCGNLKQKVPAVDDCAQNAQNKMWE